MDIKKSGTRKEYIARINRVLDYIGSHLDRPLPLDKLADVAAFSPFHFHRIFKAMMGEGVNEYAARLRLERAAVLLKNNPGASITEISYECGFSSSANFARAFKRHFGSSPTEFRRAKNGFFVNPEKFETRKIRKIGKPIGKQGKDFSPPVPYSQVQPCRDFHQERRNQEMKKVEVKHLPGYRIAYIRVMDGFNTQEIKPAFQKVMTWAKARDLFGPESLILGVILDDPEVTPAVKCRYDAAVTVPPGTEGEGEVGTYDIPAGKYAIFRVEGEYAGINEQMERAWYEFMGGWFPDSGYQPDDRPCFEIYRESEEDLKAGKFIVDLCESVKPL
jgi:AraC family transcriptional regulator